MFGSSVSLKQVRGGEKGERGMEEERRGVYERGGGASGLGIRSSLIHLDRSNQMSDCEQIAQIAQDK